MDIVKKIKAYMKSTGITPYALALAAGLHKNTLRDIHSPDWSPRLSTLRKIEAHINRQQRRAK